MTNKERIKSKFLASIQTDQYTKYKPTVLIGLIGIIGSGKSTVSKYLAENLNIPITSNDQIRRFFNENNVPGEAPMQDFLEVLAEERTKILLSRSVSHIIDADLLLHWESAKANANEFGAEFVLVQLICPEDIVLERISKRENTENNLSLANSDKYFERKKIYTDTVIPTKEIFTNIDTSKDIAEQCKSLINRIKGNV